MKIYIFGTGYVGLVTGACLAEIGHEVLCIDIDKQKIEGLKNGIIPIYEPGLEEIIKRHTSNEISRLLSFSTDIKEGIDFGDVVFCGVGTPPDKNNNNKADLTYVFQVAQSFGEYITRPKVLVNKSTVPPLTGTRCEEIIREELAKRNLNVDFDVVSNPEFLREGVAVKDFLSPDRIVIGSESEKARTIMDEIYRPIGNQSTSGIIHTNRVSAEFAKYAANTFLALKISYMNMLSRLAEELGADITEIAKAIGSDARIGRSFLNAGIGFGGSCFPKDLLALIHIGREHGVDLEIIENVITINEEQKIIPLKKLNKYFPTLDNKCIALWGLAFKPDTDDVRSASSLAFLDEILKTNVERINVYDPIAMENVRKKYTDPRIHYVGDKWETIKDVDALILFTEWNEFRNPDFNRIKNEMRGELIIDGRNIWEPKKVKEAGLTYEGIGRN